MREVVCDPEIDEFGNILAHEASMIRMKSER